MHSKLMLILCGSHVGMMEEAVLGYRAPLYGQRTAQYLLEPLGFRDPKAHAATAVGEAAQVRDIEAETDRLAAESWRL